jgi:hypothetical protein
MNSLFSPHLLLAAGFEPANVEKIAAAYRAVRDLIDQDVPVAVDVLPKLLPARGYPARKTLTPNDPVLWVQISGLPSPLPHPLPSARSTLLWMGRR